MAIFMHKCITILLLCIASTWALPTPQQHQSQQQQSRTAANCDRIFHSMVDGCKSIREKILSPTQTTPSTQNNNDQQQQLQQQQLQLCCDKFRFDLCVRSVSGYASVARATGICPALDYDIQLADINNQARMSSVVNECKNFNQSQTSCLTNSVSEMWNQVAQTVNVNSIGEQIGRGWNEAMKSMGNMAKNLQLQIQSQNIPARLLQAGTQLQSTLTQGTQRLTDLVSGQGQNRYSMVNDDAAAGAASANKDSFSLDSIVHSVIPEVEIVPLEQGGGTTAKPNAGNTGRRWSLFDMFKSPFATFNGEEPSSSSSSPLPPPNDIDDTDNDEGRRRKIKTSVEQRNNPYSTI